MSYVYCGAEDTSAHTAHGAQQAWVTNMQVASSKSFSSYLGLHGTPPQVPLSLPSLPCWAECVCVCVSFPSWSQPQDFWGEYVTWTFSPNNNGIAHQGRAG
jgi:hypothetical protein